MELTDELREAVILGSTAIDLKRLNIIDDMLELGFSEIDQELEKVER